MRILLRGPYGHLHLTKKAQSNGRAFLHLAAGLTVTGARRKRTGTLAGNTGLQCRAGVAGNARPQISDRIPMPGEVGVAHRDQVRNQSAISRLVFR